jgi:succinate--hydroxymethylglutarate CoA-transferase
MKKKTTTEWLAILEPVGIPFGPVNNIQQTFQHPQVKNRNLVREIEHSTVGPIKVVGPPIQYSVSQPSIRMPPPTLGQHTQEILKELGYCDSEIQDLRVRGLVTI